MKKVIFLLFLIFLIGCEEDTIKIGVVGSMTGTASDLSISGRRGIELAVDEINREGGIDKCMIELVVKDDENNPELAKRIVKEFVDEEVQIVIGHFTSGMMLSAYDEVNKNDILYLGPTISADSLTGIDDNFIRFISSTKEQANALGAVAKKNNHKNFAVIYDAKNIGFNEMLLNNFTAELELNDGSIVKTFTFRTITDTFLDRLVDELGDIDAVFIIAGATDFSYLAQKINRERNLALYGPLWAHTNDLLRLSGTSIEGAYLVSGIDFQNTTDTFDTFMTDYLNMFGQNVSFSSLYAYETMRIVGEVLEMVDTIDSQSIKEKILNIGTFTGVVDELYINAYGDMTRDYMIDQVVNGKFERFNEE